MLRQVSNVAPLFYGLVLILLTGNFIYQNYRQALEKIQIDGESLAALSVRLKTTNTDYERYLQEERQYLKGLRTEPEEILFTVEYMELLTKLKELR